MHYHYLLAGLPNLENDSSKPVPDLEWLRGELEEQLTASDLRLIDLVSEDSGDVQLTEEQRTHADELSEPAKTNFLAGLHYARGLKSANGFVRQWFEYLLNVNNIISALTCRKHGWDIKQQIVGEGEVAQLLRTSTLRDFGLSPIIEDYETIAAIAADDDLYNRERKIDALKWQWLEDHSFNHYFGIEQVIAYWLQVKLLTRWKTLTIEQGTETFRSLLSDLKHGTENVEI